MWVVFLKLSVYTFVMEDRKKKKFTVLVDM